MSDPVAILRNPATVRERAHGLFQMGLAGDLDHFFVHADKLPEVAAYVAAVIRENYPDLNIPYHGRWRHFTPGGVDRWGALAQKFSDKKEMVRAAIDLAVVSVLLDAGAGPDWAYTESGTGFKIGRSEGLAIASLHMFADGLFSSDKNNPLRADAVALEAVTVDRIAGGFQVSDKNPMVGLEGRVGLLKKLGAALKARPDVYGADARPGGLFDYLATGGNVKAADILGVLLETLSSIWPGRVELAGQNLGDVWPHSKITYNDDTDGLMPFHKLSQWLTYSLLEPFEWAGITVTGLDELTGLPEYRNGGLFLDMGVLELKDEEDADKSWNPGDELIVEWRALTVALLDELRLPVAKILGLEPEKFPLARMLEGGSWAAGRKIAAQNRPGGGPPLKIISDGTVF